jgi:uncharacterized membrane protein
MLFRALIFACVGIAMEVFFTATSALIFDKPRDRNLWGHSTLWMLPVYALAGLVFPILNVGLGDQWLVLRLLVYVCGIWLIEFISGYSLRTLLGEAPWEHSYRTSRWHVSGLIRLDYAPYWAVAGLLFEHLSRVLI